MSKFKEGDKVVRVSGYNDVFMKKGNTYTVESIDCDWLQFEGSSAFYDPYYFKLVEDNIIVPQLQNMKFRVENEEHSKLIQDELFKLGYNWIDGRAAMHLDKKFLFTYADGSLWHSNSKTHFDSHENIEYKFEAITTYTLIKVEPEYIEYNGVKYLKEEFEQALLSLKTF